MPIHLFVIHFPIALILAGAATDLVGAALGDTRLRYGAGHLLIAGAIAAFLAFFTGSDALAAFGRPGAPNPVLEAHTQWGGAGVWVVCGAGALRLIWARRLSGSFGWANLAVALVAGAMVIGITASGMALRHGG